MKFGARPQPNIATLSMIRPVVSKDLFLNPTLSMPMSMAEKTPTIDLAVDNCPVAPTGSPKVSPISMRSNDRIIPDGVVENRLMTKEGRNNLPTDLFSPV
jgi:hypothetical protein